MAQREKSTQPDVVHSDISGAEKRLRKLKRSFGALSRRWDRPIRRKQLYRAIWFPAAAAIGSFAFIWFLLTSPWGVELTLKHLAAFPNCAAAAAVGLAPANLGEPGYWPHHDRDGDGIACEAAKWRSHKQDVSLPPARPGGPRWVVPPH